MDSNHRPRVCDLNLTQTQEKTDHETCFLFSEDAADLESVELVANEVLQMQMPTTPAQLQNLTEEIRQKVGELGDVESILQQSTDDIQKAENLLDQARQARSVPVQDRITPTLTSCPNA